MTRSCGINVLCARNSQHLDTILLHHAQLEISAYLLDRGFFGSLVDVEKEGACVQCV